MYQQQSARRRPEATSRLGQKQHHILALVGQGPFDQINRETPQPRQGHHCLFEILRMGRPVHAGFRDRAHVESPLGLTHGRRMRARRLAKLALHRGGNVIDGIANGGN
jgi:hypothetical protein